jgi:hypothetical protein
VEIRPGKQSEFAIYADEELLFSRLQQMRYPENGEIIVKLRELS